MKLTTFLVSALAVAVSASEETVIEPRGMAKVNEYRYGDWYLPQCHTFLSFSPQKYY